jgi:Immunity protein 35
MKLKSFEEAKAIANNLLNNSHPNSHVIIDNKTIEFEWGYIFHHVPITFLETGRGFFGTMGYAPVLVDKIDGTTHWIGGKLKYLDTQLEEYRESKGYPPCIKYPVKENLEGKSVIEQIQILFKTEEISQIKGALKLAEETKAFDIDILKKILYSTYLQEHYTFEESIAFTFNSDSLFIDLQKEGNLPNDLRIFNCFEAIGLTCDEPISINDNILQFNNLISLNFEDITGFRKPKINYLTPKLLELKYLKAIHLERCEISQQVFDVLLLLKKEKGIFISTDYTELKTIRKAIESEFSIHHEYDISIESLDMDLMLTPSKMDWKRFEKEKKIYYDIEGDWVTYSFEKYKITLLFNDEMLHEKAETIVQDVTLKLNNNLNQLFGYWIRAKN